MNQPFVSSTSSNVTPGTDVLTYFPSPLVDDQRCGPFSSAILRACHAVCNVSSPSTSHPQEVPLVPSSSQPSAHEHHTGASHEPEVMRWLWIVVLTVVFLLALSATLIYAQRKQLNDIDDLTDTVTDVSTEVDAATDSEKIIDAETDYDKEEQPPLSIDTKEFELPLLPPLSPPATPCTVLVLPSPPPTPTFALSFPYQSYARDFPSYSLLPPSVMIAIGKYLSLRSLLVLSSVSHHWLESLYDTHSENRHELFQLWSRHSVTVRRTRSSLMIDNNVVRTTTTDSIDNRLSKILVTRLSLVPSLQYHSHIRYSASLTSLLHTVTTAFHNLVSLTLDVRPLTLTLSFLLTHWPRSLLSLTIVGDDRTKPTLMRRCLSLLTYKPLLSLSLQKTMIDALLHMMTRHYTVTSASNVTGTGSSKLLVLSESLQSLHCQFAPSTVNYHSPDSQLNQLQKCFFNLRFLSLEFDQSLKQYQPSLVALSSLAQSQSLSRLRALMVPLFTTEQLRILSELTAQSLMAVTLTNHEWSVIDLTPLALFANLRFLTLRQIHTVSYDSILSLPLLQYLDLTLNPQSFALNTHFVSRLLHQPVQRQPLLTTLLVGGSGLIVDDTLWKVFVTNTNTGTDAGAVIVADKIVRLVLFGDVGLLMDNHVRHALRHRFGVFNDRALDTTRQRSCEGQWYERVLQAQFAFLP